MISFTIEPLQINVPKLPVPAEFGKSEDLVVAENFKPPRKQNAG
jgi:hypothetical protein